MNLSQKMNEPIAEWNLQPGNSTWLKIRIWRNLEDMKAYVTSIDPDFGDDYEACYLGNDWRFTKDNVLLTRYLGNLHFANGYYGSGIVAHELQHFLSQLISTMGLDINEDNDNEIVSMVIGYLTNQFWKAHFTIFNK